MRQKEWKTKKHELIIYLKTSFALGEFDEIDLVNKIFCEDKTAKGLDIVNPKTGLVAQTPQQFADKQIFKKIKKRITALGEATATRSKDHASSQIPTIEEIRDIKHFVFRLDGNTPELKSAVENSINKLKKFQDYKFDATFGGG